MHRSNISHNRLVASLLAGVVALTLSAQAADQLAAVNSGPGSPQRIATPTKELPSPAWASSVPAEAAQQFQAGKSFYIYRDETDTVKGKGTLEGTIKFLRHPESQAAPVRIYAFVVGKGLYGENRRFGSVGELVPCETANGELKFTFSSTFRSSVGHSSTSVSGKGTLHIVLLPSDCDPRKVRMGLMPQTASNEIVIPAEF